LKKAKLAFKQELKRSKLTSKQSQEEKRERNRSELKKYNKQKQARERDYMFSPS